MFEFIALICAPVQKASIWDTIFAILAAFIGGGLATLIFDAIRARTRARKIRRLINNEIRMNLEVLESDTFKQNPWLSHKTWTAFYDSNSIEVTSFKSEDTISNILKFYSHLETLRMRDKDDEDVERLNKEENYAGAQALEQQIGVSKQGTRNTLIELAHKILDEDEKTGKPTNA